jgi:diguanylate cyclase (GGDEF)-like protein/PAS domain S-box-containing protein
LNAAVEKFSDPTLDAAIDALHRVLDAVPHPIFVKDISHRMVVLNQSMCDLMGQSRCNLIGRTDYELVPEEQAEIFQKYDRHVFETGQIHENEEPLSSGKGRARWIRTRKKRVDLSSGEQLLIGCISDITDLRDREASFRLLFEGNPVPMWVYDRVSLRFLAVNNAAIEHYGYCREQFLAMSILDIRPPDEVGGLCNTAQETSLQRAGSIWRHLRQDGSTIFSALYTQSLEYQGQQAALVAAIDVTEQRRAQEELIKTRLFLNTMIENLPANIAVVEGQNFRYVHVNRACEHFYGIERARIVGRTADEIFLPETARLIAENYKCVLRSAGSSTICEHEIVTPANGTRLATITNVPIINDMKQLAYILTVIEDVTERRQIEQRIAHLAYYDALTDLHNRAAFSEHLSEAIERCRKSDQSFAVLCLDLDHFKEVNDVLGHAAGDAVLCEVAKRLVAVADGAFVSRLGGDEFVLIVSEGQQPSAAAGLADRVLAALTADFEIGGNRLRIGASIGVAIYPHDGTNAGSLFSNADAALYRAKTEGRGVIDFFEPNMDLQLRERRGLMSDLRSALEKGELRVHYQPFARMDGEVFGFEALMRWRHPKKGFVPPSVFVPLAEESGLILALGEWILRETCREAASWARPLQIAVNLSPIQFKHGDLPGLVQSILVESGLDPARLGLEITEGVLIGDPTRALSILRRLKALGVRIVMDDFGTGYSSLSYLQSFPFDKLKIDRRFVSNLMENKQSAAIVRAIVSLGHALDMPVTAEGVEAAEQLELLKQEQCNEVQGYWIGKPAPIEHYRQTTGLLPTTTANR